MASRFVNVLFRAVEGLISIALVVILTEVIVEVSARYIFHTSLPWGAEVSQTLLVWLTFLGAAEACRRNEHMAVRFILEGLPSKKLRKALDLSGKLIMLVFVSVSIWSGWQVVQRTWSMKTTALQIPAGILYLALPAGFLIMILAIVDSFFYRENAEMTEEDDISATGDWR